MLEFWHTQFKGNLHKKISTLLLQFVLPPCPLCLITLLNNFITIHACHDPSLKFATNAKAYKGATRECNMGVTFTFLECEKV